LAISSTVPKLYQILSLDRGCTRIWHHLVRQAIHLLQGFSLHLQLHLRILFEDLGIALPQELSDPFICDTAGLSRIA
jgi:hypothetical protein